MKNLLKDPKFIQRSKNDKLITRDADKQERWVGNADSPTPRERYGFVEFKNEEDADYAIKIMNMIRTSSTPVNFSCMIFSISKWMGMR